MFYQFYELNHAIMAPWRAAADAMRLAYSNPLNPLSQTYLGRTAAAGLEVFERSTRRYGKPEFGLDETIIDNRPISIDQKIVWRQPFCNLIHFERVLEKPARSDPRVLIVAPMSGHYATLLRGTVEALLPTSDVYITDWIDARMVPLTEGTFDLSTTISNTSSRSCISWAPIRMSSRSASPPFRFWPRRRSWKREAISCRRLP